MTTTIADVRPALSDAVQTIDGLRCVAYVADQVNTNQAMIVRGDVDYALVMADRPAIYNYTIVVYAPRPAERSSQMFLDQLAEPTGAKSMKAALEYGEATLGDLVDYVHVASVSGVTVATVGDVDYLTETFTVEVCISST